MFHAIKHITRLLTGCSAFTGLFVWSHQQLGLIYFEFYQNGSDVLSLNVCISDLVIFTVWVSSENIHHASGKLSSGSKCWFGKMVSIGFFLLQSRSSNSVYIFESFLTDASRMCHCLLSEFRCLANSSNFCPCLLSYFCQLACKRVLRNDEKCRCALNRALPGVFQKVVKMLFFWENHCYFRQLLPGVLHSHLWTEVLSAGMMGNVITCSVDCTRQIILFFCHILEAFIFPNELHEYCWTECYVIELMYVLKGRCCKCPQMMTDVWSLTNMFE